MSEIYILFIASLCAAVAIFVGYFTNFAAREQFRQHGLTAAAMSFLLFGHVTHSLWNRPEPTEKIVRVEPNVDHDAQVMREMIRQNTSALLKGATNGVRNGSGNAGGKDSRL